MAKQDYPNNVIPLRSFVSEHSFQSHCANGRLYRDQGCLDKAIIEWRKALELDKTNPSLYLDLGAALAEQGLLEEATTCFSCAVKLAPDTLEPYYYLGLAHFQSSDPELAIKYWKKCLHFDPENADIRMCLAEAYRDLGKWTKACHQLEHILEYFPLHIDALNMMAVLYLERGRLNEAIEILRDCVSLDPEFARSHGNLGAAYQQQGFLDMAILEFRRAARINPLDADHWYNLGHALAVRGEARPACEALNKSLAIDPSRIDCMLILGNLQLFMGYIDDARQTFLRVVDINPQEAEALGALGEIEHRSGHLKEAEDYLQQALTVDPNSPVLQYGLALLYFEQDMLGPALVYARKATSSRPDRAEYQLLLGDILSAKGRLPAAKECWELALELDPSLRADEAYRLKNLSSHIK